MRKSVSSLVSIAFLVAQPLWGHHNMSALFDFNQRFTETGSLTEINWINPHVQLSIAVKKETGELETWSFEGPPPSFFRNRDVDKSQLEGSRGMTVTVEASRARDGSKHGLIRQITLADGSIISACPQNC